MLIAFVPLFIKYYYRSMPYVIMWKYLGFAELSLHDALYHHAEIPWLRRAFLTRCPEPS